MDTDSVCYTKIREHQASCHCRPKRLNSSVFMLLCFIISLLFWKLFSIIGIIQKKNRNLVGIYCRNQANCIIHHGGLLFVASSSSIDSIWDQPIQQVHALHQGGHRSVEHTSPTRWRWRGRSRWSAWSFAPPIRSMPPRRCHDIGWDIIKSVTSYGIDTG